MARDQRFRKHEHLRLRSEFARVYAVKCTASDDALVVYVAGPDVHRDRKWSRLGLSVSKRVGNAVCRNTLRRRIRAAFRTNKDKLPVGYDIVCVVRPQAGKRSYDLSGAFTSLVVRAVRSLNRRGGRSR